MTNPISKKTISKMVNNRLQQKENHRMMEENRIDTAFAITENFQTLLTGIGFDNYEADIIADRVAFADTRISILEIAGIESSHLLNNGSRIGLEAADARQLLIDLGLIQRSYVVTPKGAMLKKEVSEKRQRENYK